MEENSQKPAQSPRRKWLRIVGVTAAVLLALVLLVALGAAALLSSEAGRLWLVNTALEKGLGAGPVQVSIRGARTRSLGAWSFERIEVTREQELWLDIRELKLLWEPRQLLQKRLLVEAISARRLDVYTSAGSDAEPKPKQQTKGGGGTLPSLAIQTFKLDTLNILTDRDIPSYRVVGDLYVHWDKLPLRLDLDIQSLPRQGQAPMALSIKSTSEHDKQLTLSGSLREGADGHLGLLLQLPQNTAIDAGFEATIDVEKDDYHLVLRHLILPFLDHQISARGELAIGKGLKKWQIPDLVLDIDSREHHVAGAVTVVDSAPQLDLHVQLDQFPLDLLSPWVAQVDSGALSADLQITGALTDPQIIGRAWGTSEYRQYPVEMDVAGDFSLQRLDFRQLSVNLGVAQFQGHGLLDLKSSNSQLNFELQNLPSSYLALAAIEPPEGLDGHIVSAEGTLSGDYRKPSGKVSVQAQGHYRQQPFDMQVDAQGDTGLIRLQTATLTLGDAQAQVQGLLDIHGDQSNLKLTLDSMPLDLLALAGVDLPPDLDVAVNASAQMRGPLTSPQASGSLSAKGFYREQAFTIAIEGRGNRQRVALQQAQLQLGEASLSAQGAVDLKGKTVDMGVSLDNAPLGLLELAQIELPPSLTAEITGSAKVTGPLSLPEVVSKLTAKGSYQELPFTLIVDGSFVQRRIEIGQVRLDLDEVTALTVQGYLHPDAYDLQLIASDLPTRTLSALGWDLVTGDFNATMRVRGTPDAPDIEGEFVYQSTLFGLDLGRGEETAFELGWNTQVNTEEQVLHVQSSFTRDQQETGNFQLTLPITRYLDYLHRPDPTRGFPLEFDANGAVDLAVLGLVLDPDIHRISGRAAVRMKGNGSLAQPDLTGVFELLNTRYENTLTGTLLSDIQLLLRASGTEIIIAEGSARDGGDGRLQASGVVDWADGTREDAVNVKLEAHNISLLNREDLDGEVSGDIALTGSFEELWLKGDLAVQPFSANIDAALQSRIPEIEVTEIYGNPAEIEATPLATTGTGPKINLDLTVEADQQAFLRGRGLEAELAGDIHLSGTLAEPNYKGEFSIVRGVFEVFGRKFVLQEGKVLFANNALYLLIPGAWEQEDYTIRAELSGTVDNLALNLSSVPTLPEDEILSLLIFGKSAQNITPFQAIRLAAAVQTLRGGGGGGFDPIGSTRDVLGVDTLSVESASTETGTGVSVGVGKYINERVYLEVKRTPSEVQPWQGSVEIELSPRLLLRSTAGGEGRTRADLLWKRDY